MWLSAPESILLRRELVHTFAQSLVIFLAAFLDRCDGEQCDDLFTRIAGVLLLDDRRVCRRCRLLSLSVASRWRGVGYFRVPT